MTGTADAKSDGICTQTQTTCVCSMNEHKPLLSQANKGQLKHYDPWPWYNYIGREFKIDNRPMVLIQCVVGQSKLSLSYKNSISKLTVIIQDLYHCVRLGYLHPGIIAT